MFNKTLLCAGVCLAFAAAGASESHAALRASAPSSQQATSVPAPAGTTVLFTQTGTADNGIPAQNFETLYDAYDSEGADDFTVPAGGWGVNSVNFPVTVSDGGDASAATWNIKFYADAAGTPSAGAECTYSALAGTGGTAAGGTIVVALPTECALSAGVHWFSAQSNLDAVTNGQTFWTNFVAPAVGASAVFRNPGDGFGSGCTAFAATATCIGGTPPSAIGGGNPNLIFQLLGRTTPVELQSYSVD